MPNQYRQWPDPFAPIRQTTGAVVAGVGRLVGTAQNPVQTGQRAAGVVVDTLPSAGDVLGLTGLDDAVSKAGAWASDRNNWVRVAKVVAGGALIIVGLANLAVKPAAQIAGAVAPVGKLAKKVGG